MEEDLEEDRDSKRNLLSSGANKSYRSTETSTIQAHVLSDERAEIIQKNALKRKEHATTDFETLIHLLKGNIGTGLLALPMATNGAGYVLGPLGILLLGLIAMHCMVLLVDCANRLCTVYDVPTLDYSETMQFAIKRFGGRPKFSRTGKYVVNFFLIFTQFGFCSVYLVFVGQSVQQVVNETYCVDYDKRLWILIVLLPVIFLSWIRNLDHLSALSMLANICILAGLCVIIYDEIDRFTTGRAEAVKPHPALHPFGQAEKLALFFGNALFSYEAIGVVLPLENKMKSPSHAKRVIYFGMSIVTVLYASFGLFGYLTYGQDIRASITLNLCPTNAYTAFVFLLTKLLFAYSIFMSYLLQFYVPMDFLEPIVFKVLRLEKLFARFPRNRQVLVTIAQIGLRTILVLLTASLAIGVPDLGDLLTLIGAVASSGLAMIFPPLIHMLTYWNEDKGTEREKPVHVGGVNGEGEERREEIRRASIFPKPIWVAKDIAIITLGVVGCAFGTYAALHSIVLFFEKNGDEDYCTEGEAAQFQTYCHLVPS